MSVIMGHADNGRFVTALGKLSLTAIRHPGRVLAVIVVILALAAAFAPQLLTDASPYATKTAQRLLPPSSQFWFGTDYLGRDLYTRVVYGAALSLKASVIAVGVGCVAGSAIGLVAGFSGRILSAGIMRVVDILLAIPGLLLALTIVTVLGAGTVNIAIAVGVGTVATFARVMRAEVLHVRSLAFVEAARGVGVSWFGVMMRHVLPNAAGPVLVLAGIEFGSAILSVSALSFLGFGAPPPQPEWGALVSEGRNYLARAWWITTMPGLVVVAVVLSINTLGRAADTKRRNVGI